jgi:hypothetical protein
MKIEGLKKDEIKGYSKREIPANSKLDSSPSMLA